MGMNKKGIFLTFMVFLLIGAVLTLNTVIKQADVNQERKIIDESAFSETNEQFNSIYNQILSEREEYAGVVQQRIIPQAGAYSASGNTMEITQQVPPAEYGTSQSDTLDALNLFSIFIATPEINQGLDINSKITTAFNLEAWGGSGGENPEYGYLIQPYCIRYLPLKFGERFMGYQIPGEDWDDWVSEKADGKCTKIDSDREYCYYWGCEKPFDMANIKNITIDFNVGAPYPGCTAYLESSPLNCQQGSNSFNVPPQNCKSSCDNPNNPNGDNPCVTINFHEEQCQGACKIDGTKVAANSDIDMTGNVVTLSFEGGDIILYLLSKNDPQSNGKMFLMYYAGDAICLINTAKVNITFVGPVGTVQYAGFDFSVKKPGFDYCRRTAGANCD